MIEQEFSEGYYPGNCERCGAELAAFLKRFKGGKVTQEYLPLYRELKDKALNDKKACIMSEWYPPGLIRYCRNQLIWLIENLMPLDVGEWPSEGKESRGVHSHRAPFEMAAMISGEIKLRLKSTGRSGGTLVWEIQHGTTDYDELAPEAKLALNYITGANFKRISFSKWRYKQKGKSDSGDYFHLKIVKPQHLALGGLDS